MKSNYAYLLAPFFAWLIAQLLKNVLNASRQGSAGIAGKLRSGDMPSAHTAVVMSLAVAVFVHEGLSNLFAVVIWFSAIIIYDALVARRSIGEQGKALLRLIEKSSFANDPLPRVAIGHKPLEVIVGAAIGAGVGAIVALFITV